MRPAEDYVMAVMVESSVVGGDGIGTDWDCKV